MAMYYDEKTVLYYDGKFLKASQASTDLYGQSLHYGYAVFEGIKSYKTKNGTKIFKAEEHYDRLKRSAELMMIPFDYSTQEMIEITYQLLEMNHLSNAYIRPLVICAPNMGLLKASKSSLVIEAWSWNAYFSDPIRVMTSSFERPNPKAFRIEAKASGHYINSILASEEAKKKGFNEALLLDGEGNVAESSGANVFYEKDSKLYTPAKGSILPGITRETIFEICAQLGISCEEKFFKPIEMEGVDAAFFCGTAAEVAPVESLNNIPFKLKWEDSLSAIIQKAYRHLVLQEDYTYLKPSLYV